MTEIKNFFDLEAWKQAHQLVLAIYKLTETFPQREIFGITNQLRRAVSSIAANIAEGFERFHFNDKIRFYYQARGSIAEVQNFLILSRDLGYMQASECQMLLEQSHIVHQLINGLIRAIERQKQQ